VKAKTALTEAPLGAFFAAPNCFTFFSQALSAVGMFFIPWDRASPQQTITKTHATGLTEVANFNTNGTVGGLAGHMGQTTAYAYDATHIQKEE